MQPTGDKAMTDTLSPTGKNGGSQPKTAVKTAARQDRQQRVISNPEDIAKLVMLQIDAIGARKDDLTVALRRLTDTTRQLARAYAQQTAVIQGMQKRIKELEEKAGVRN